MELDKHPNIQQFIDDSMKNSKVQLSWDFNTALGDTIKEKYESLYVKVVELTKKLIKQGTKGYFWLLVSQEVSTIFETATAGFAPAPRDYDNKFNGQLPMGLDHTELCGLVSAKWRLYSSSNMPDDALIVGADSGPVGTMELTNFVI